MNLNLLFKDGPMTLTVHLVLGGVNTPTYLGFQVLPSQPQASRMGNAKSDHLYCKHMLLFTNY